MTIDKCNYMALVAVRGIRDSVATVFSASPLLIVAVIASIALSGCANNDATLTTSSLNAQPVVATKVDPACISLSARIAELRKEGTMARLAKVSTGKSRSVAVKRAALAKAAKLDAANSEFQAKCSHFGTTTAAVTQPAAATAVKKVAKTAPVKAATTTAKKAATKSVKTAATVAVKKQ